jgi:hypothetical protein
MFKKLFGFSNLTLLVALTLSTIAAWYSIIGLTAIFAGAVIPIIIMGSALELAKITTTVWLRKYWKRCSWVIKMYLVPAVIALAVLTSMGIFGFLSKAHLDQGVPTGDVAAKVALLDEKIKTERDNIETSRKALQQMDAQVDQMLGRTDNDKGAERAVQIRRQQQKERGALQADITKAQTVIAKLNEERAPIASELRKVEAEVGPIKYIAALIYGDNPDANLLERAVRWVIILLVLVFDPLALMLVIAANQSREWDDEEEKEQKLQEFIDNSKEVARRLDTEESLEGLPDVTANYEPDDGPLTDEQVEQLKKSVEVFDTVKEESVQEPINCYKCGTELIEAPGIGLVCPNKECKDAELKEEPEVEVTEPTVDKEVTADSSIVVTEIETEGVTSPKPFKELEGGYVVFDGKHMHRDVLKESRPDLFKLVADSARSSNTSFGTEFPKTAEKGDTFVRVDVLPNRVYKFDGVRWIAVNKEISTSYLHDQEYIKFLIKMIDKGEYDIDLLSETEKQQIEEYLTQNR